MSDLEWQRSEFADAALAGFHLRYHLVFAVGHFGNVQHRRPARRFRIRKRLGVQFRNIRALPIEGRKTDELPIQVNRNLLDSGFGHRPSPNHTCFAKRASAHRRIQSSQNRSEEHTSELQSLRHLVCRLLLEKKKTETPPI